MYFVNPIFKEEKEEREKKKSFPEFLQIWRKDKVNTSE